MSIMNEITSNAKFVAKKDTWFLEKSEPNLIGNVSYFDDTKDKFKNGAGLFNGLTMEAYDGYNGILPREDEESCVFEEFYIYDQHGIEISEMTLKEYKTILREKNIDLILDERNS